MNFVSVTGKDWVLKRFDSSKLASLKDNFYLDEITAKLLLLRNVKFEEIQNYLNPSIKEFLPNPNVLLDMDRSSKRTCKFTEVMKMLI